MDEGRYNIRIRLKAWNRWSTFKFWITLQELEETLVAPYHQGGPIIVDGRIMPLEDIDRITIKRINEVPRQPNLIERVLSFVFPGR